MNQILTYKKKYRFTNDLYVALVVLHLVIGAGVYFIPLFSNLYFTVVCFYFLGKVILSPKRSKTMWVLFGCAYIAAAESLFRMTGGGLFYEFSKYYIILLVLVGMFFTGVSNNSYPYFIYFILLVPAVLVASTTLGYDLNFRKSIAFVLSGPVCLGASALYCYDKKITQEQLLQILACMTFPVLAMMIYLFLYNPSIKDVLQGTGSNFEASGGYGPNQVASLLGLGMVVLTVRFFLKSPSLFLKLFNLGFLALVSFRALVTFSRGGVITAIMMIIGFLIVLYGKSRYKRRQQIIGSLFLLGFSVMITWSITASQTEGMIENRYTNKNAKGVEKEDLSTGRVDLFVREFEGFLRHPFFGVGANGMKQVRLEEEGKIIASHNEVSRLFSEHGIFGLIILLLLIFTPLVYRLQHKGNLLFYSFLIFWFATINHSAMRIAAPGFIYGLSLLHITYEKKRPVPRKQLIEP
ncbi:O-antigen ligase family protein [Winogradskyella arenosi]|uniref:O-antigen ligase-like membrane protein n=1 Tax=Winogradskyella arenosi TaxID=533325 RepID=A0A368ZJF4_9FLAO|nr:O-antigen ligase family protein [Winogradskyella arenosi]RCW91491.1 O-antigen ligase-like membrane protein [Winogradskyella arenosi]